MHARNRNPANGYRSTPVGFGGGGVAGGGPAYRSYNRSGFGRGQAKVFQPPPPRRGDVFMEAGKLATEYLVSKGLLPPNSLNGRWQNNSGLKNQVGGENGVPDSVSGTGGGRRRFLDDHGSATGSRDGVRERRRIESFKSPGVESNREINRSGSWSEKVKGGSPDKQGDDDSFSEHKSGRDGVVEEQKSVSGDLESKSCNDGNLETAAETNQNQNQNELPDDNMGSKASSSAVSHEGGVESMENLKTSKEEVMLGDDNGESEEPTVTEDTHVENSAKENNDNLENKNGSDLLTLIRLNKIPTRTRSSVTHKGSKVDPVLIGEDENTNEAPRTGESVGPLHHVSTGNAPSDENQGLNPESNIPEASSAEEALQLDNKYKFGQGLCKRSQSFPEISTVAEQEIVEGQPGYTHCSSAQLDRSEKRPLDVVDSGEGSKKPRDWAASDAQADDYLQFSNSRGDQNSSQEGRPLVTEPCNAYTEEKQLFPSSFKICDLNLMGVSDVNEHHDTSSVLTFPSIVQPKQEPVSVNFDLSMSSMRERHTRRGADGKEVEVIDLDCDSVQDDKVFNNSEQKEDAIFTDLESFPDSMQRVNDMPQDGYGLMISELLEADIPSSTVSTSVNSMHNEIGLHNEEGMLGDDESIYMSLGEIPISMPKL